MTDTLFSLIYSGNDSLIALKDVSEEITYKELKKRILSLSEILRKKFNNMPFRVLFALPASIKLSVMIFAAVKAGGLVFMASPDGDEVWQLRKKYGIDTVVSADDEKGESPETFMADNGTVYNVSEKTTDTFGASLAFFTSGTFGEPKCVLLSEKNLCSNVKAGCEMLSFENTDIHLNTLPFYHAYGITCSLLAPLYSGGTLCFGKGIASFFDDLEYFKPSFIQTVPLVAESLLKYSNVKEISIKKILSGGAHTPPELIKAFRKKGIAVYSCYGMTECSPCISCNDGCEENDDSEGRLLSCNEISFFDGEILLRGDNVMCGYFGESRQTGFFRTGDIGFLDEKGYLHIVGRKNGCIKLPNGERLFPEEVERIAEGFCGVAESRAVYENMKIILEVFSGEKEINKYALLDYVNSRMPAFSRVSDIRIMKAPLPKTATMKIKRN